MYASTPYLTGEPAPSGVPLARYLPPVLNGVATTWLRQHAPLSTGGEFAWILDPFGASPRIALEAARLGYPVLVAANNPVARFLLEMAAAPPSEAELRSALAELAATYKGEERMEPHIRSLYRTDCANCGREIMAEAFLWERGAAAPYARIYTCPFCADAGERPATPADATRAEQFNASLGLHRARALERVAPTGDPDRPHAEEALAAYLPRAVYALFTLINKLSALPTSGSRRLLEAMLLSACDQANTLWPSPIARARPRALTIPTRFRENNVWLALEEAVSQWAVTDPPLARVALTTWPTPPPAGGICLYEGRLRDLAGELEPVRIKAVLAALPRPNQAFWTLSALWAGWLCGRESAAAFKSVLRRRRYDWAWHSTALHAALSILAERLQPGTPFLGLIGEAEPGFLSAAMVAAEMSGFDLDGVSLRTGEGQAQLTWQRAEGRPAPKPQPLQDIARDTAQALLRLRGEPSHYLYVHTAALSGLASSHALPDPADTPPADCLAHVQSVLQAALTYRGGFLRYGGSEHSPEVGLWWLREPGLEAEAPLSDRVEMAVVSYLQKNAGATLDKLEAAALQAFPGLLSPERDLVEKVAQSYAEQQPGNNGWLPRPEDTPRARRTDLASIQTLLAGLGSRLGFSVEGQSPVLWKDGHGEVCYAFHVLASAVFGRVLGAPLHPPNRSVIVYPGGRAGLMAYKLEHNPALKQAVEAGWRFVKFRHLRRLAESALLSRETLDGQLDQDPMKNEDAQMQLL